MTQLQQNSRMSALLLCGLLLLACCTNNGQAAAETCESSQGASTRSYSAVLETSRASHVDLNGLPGFTRSAYHRDHALITPESRVWAPQPGWVNALTSHLISPASGASFSMYLAQLKAQGQAGAAPAASVERFVLVLNGQAQLTESTGAAPTTLPANHYAYFPPNTTARLTSTEGADLLVYERHYIAQGKPVVQHGMVDDSPILPAPGEVFKLRKLLPQTTEYDFNIHIMDFQPGEYLFVKEIHYNQHGLLLLEGQGIYRLADKWYSVQAGDAIWMAPYVIQWYAALGTTGTRYVILKDTTVDPLLS